VTGPPRFVYAASLEAIPEGRGLAVDVAGRALALFRLGPEVYAVEDRCPHQLAELSTGTLSPDGVLTCAWHGWRFPLREEARAGCPWMPCPASFPVKVEAGAVYVGTEPSPPPARPSDSTSDSSSGNASIT